jgi:hypothetical protein
MNVVSGYELDYSKPMAKGLAMWLPFDGKGHDTIARDCSGNGNNGTLTNFTFDGTTNGWFPGKFRNCLKLNGSNNYVKVVATSTISAPFTVSAWVYVKSFSAASNFFDTRIPGNYFDVKVFANNYIHGDIGNGSSWISTGLDESVSTISPNTWHLITYAITPTLAFLYFDGALISTQSLTSAPVLVPANGEITIGVEGLGMSEYFNGALADLRVYNRALSAAEVWQLHATSPYDMLLKPYNFEKDETTFARYMARGGKVID